MFETKYILLFFLIILVLYGLKKALKRKEIFNPILLFSLPILISLCINLAVYDQKYSISSETYILYFWSVFVFAIGLLFGTRNRSRHKLYIKSRVIRSKGSKFIKMMWVLMVFCSIFALIQIYKGYTSGIYGTGLSNFINNIRYYTGYVSGNNFFAKYGIVFSDFLILYYLYLRYIERVKTRKNLLCVFLCILFYLIFTATEFNKTNFLYLFCVILFFYVLGNMRHLRKVIVIGFIMLLFFVIILNSVSQLTGKGIIEGEHWAYFYFGSEFRWLDVFAIKNNFNTSGYMSLGIIGRFLTSINVISLDGYNAYREVALQYNSPVSSFVLGPYLDFGYFGMFVLFGYGLLIGWIYSQHKKIGKFWTILYSTCIYQLVISFFAFQFGMSNQVYVAVLFLCFMLFSKKRIYYQRMCLSRR